MVRFDLSDIINDSELPSSFEEICELAYKLSVQTSAYVAKTKDLTVGLKPTEGLAISQLPDTDPTAKLINGTQTSLNNIIDRDIPEIYAVNAFQILIASGVLPLGWLSRNKKYANLIYQDLYESWVRIVLDSAPVNCVDGPLYPHTKSFGLVARMIGGHKNSDLVFFVIYDNQVDYNFLQNYLTKNDIKNIVLMSESEYAENLVNGIYYTFLVKFDKLVNQYTGITFKANTKLVESVPTYLLEIGCSSSCVLFREAESDQTNPRYKTVEFKKGAPVTTVIYVPNNHRISLVSLNGTTYFNGTEEMNAAGITVTETDVTTLTGYRTFSVTVSGLTNNAKFFINTCEDLTGTQVTKSMISGLSTINVTNQDISLNLIFNRPFIYLDTSKIKVWVKKDDEYGEELVTAKTILTDGQKYVERKSTFTDAYQNPMYCNSMTPPPAPRPDEVMRGHNPYIFDNRKLTCGGCTTAPKEPEFASNVILYNVTECGSVIITFDGYSKYKYFRVEFEDRAMIATFKVTGTDRVIDIIPVINDVKFTNEYYDKIIDDDDDDGVNNDGDADNNTKPDVVISPSLGISYDAK